MKLFTFFSLVKIEHWLGPTVVDSLLYVMLVCVSFSFSGIVVSSLNVFVLRCLLVLEISFRDSSKVFVGFRDQF